MRWSSTNTPDQDEFVIFSASARMGNKIQNQRYGINVKGEIYTNLDSIPERVELLKTGVVDSIQRHFSLALNKGEKIRLANVGEKEFRPENRGEKELRHGHRDEKKLGHRHRGEKELGHGHRGEKESDHEHRAEEKARHGHRVEKPKHSDHREKEKEFEFVRPLSPPTKESDFVGPLSPPKKESMFVRALNPPTSKTNQNRLFSAQNSTPVAQKKAGNPNITGGKRRDQHEPFDKLKGQIIPTRNHRKQAAQDIGPNPGKKGGIFEQPAKEKEPSVKTQPPGPRTPRRN